MVQAKVIKRDTADGVSFLLDEVPIGHVYLVDLDSRHLMDWRDIRGVITKRESICVYGAATAANKTKVGFMPTELLEIEHDRSRTDRR